MKKIYNFGLFLLILGIVFVSVGAVLLFNLKSDVGIGIIGGADGPTLSFYLSHTDEGRLALLGFVLGGLFVICGLVGIIFRKWLSKNNSIKSIVISLLLSASAGLFIYCVINGFLCLGLGGIDRHPIAIRVYITAGCVSALAFLALMIVYVKHRINKPSAKGVVAEVALAHVCIIPFMYMCGVIYSICANLIK